MLTLFGLCIADCCAIICFTIVITRALPFRLIHAVVDVKVPFGTVDGLSLSKAGVFVPLECSVVRREVN